MLDSLFARYDRVVVLDTETTGISCRSEEIIELAAVALTREGVADEMDEFIRLSPGRRVPPKIVELTGITQEMIDEEGISKYDAAVRFAGMLGQGKTLVVAYNAQFDLCFLYFFLSAFGLAGCLQAPDMLDAMTVYKDRRPYPHKLQNAIDAYGVTTQNTHRAVDDCKATVELLEAMAREEDDLSSYVNLFGYSAKYGVSGPKIRSITYRPQGFNGAGKLYDQMTIAGL